MSSTWTIPSADDVLNEFTPAEVAALQRAQGKTTNLASILSRVVAEIRDSIRSGGYALDLESAATLPAGLHNDAILITRWRWLLSIPAVKSLQTEGREKAADRALEKLGKIANQKFAVESPIATQQPTSAGNWNSENKVIMRTHPVPRPGKQFQATEGIYADENAPGDAT